MFGFFVNFVAKSGFPPLHDDSGLFLQIVQKSWAKHIYLLLLLILTSVSCPNQFIIGVGVDWCIYFSFCFGKKMGAFPNKEKNSKNKTKTFSKENYLTFQTALRNHIRWVTDNVLTLMLSLLYVCWLSSDCGKDIGYGKIL